MESLGRSRAGHDRPALHPARPAPLAGRGGAQPCGRVLDEGGARGVRGDEAAGLSGMGDMGKRLGILGGMGPLASAEFLSTLYRLNLVEPEQDAPNCVLLSDPSFPDRTEAILAGDTRELARRLEASLQELLRQGTDRIVIAC